jgi:hypothetical protein
MRNVLVQIGYRLDHDRMVWFKEGGREFPDSRIEEDHFRVLIESMRDELFRAKAANFLRKNRRAT